MHLCLKLVEVFPEYEVANKNVNKICVLYTLMALAANKWIECFRRCAMSLTAVEIVFLKRRFSAVD
jgi:hypothetical protein